jgi:hypothetical protein
MSVYVWLVSGKDGLEVKVSKDGESFCTLIKEPSVYLCDGSEAKISHCSSPDSVQRTAEGKRSEFEVKWPLPGGDK